MASRNRPLPNPPVTNKVLDSSSEVLSSIWVQWINSLHYLISNKNHQEITGASEINLDAEYVSLTTTSAGYAVTLEPPTIPGRYKVIEMIARGGSNNVTLSLTNCTNGSASTTCTWNSVGDTLVVVSKSNKWVIIAEDGVSLT